MDERMRIDLLALQAELRRRGVFAPATANILAEWAYNLILTAAVAGWWLLDAWWLRFAAVGVSTVGLLGISTCAHTAAHGAAVPWRRLNAALAYFGYPFMLMVSAHYWRQKHNVVHHPTPNVVGVDADCDLMPFFATHEAQARAAGPVRAFYYRRLQGWVFPLAVTLNGFNVQRASWAYLLGRLCDPHTRRYAHSLDLGALLAHVAVWIVLPCALTSIGDALLLYALRIGLLGHAMFCAFAPAHFPLEADFLEPGAAGGDFVMRQAQATVNFRTGPLGRLACNGVEYQIEHHLFPGICHVHYPAVAPLVREFCRTHGYPYRVIGWGEGIWKSYASLFHLRPIRRIAGPWESLPAPLAGGA
jgi:linoleoyl-CoA desaturase